MAQKKLAEKVWVDGEIVNWEDATIHVISHVIHYGSSVFEGIRCYNVKGKPKIFRLRDHIHRLYDSAKMYRMEIPYSQEEFMAACKEIIRANGFQSCYVRPIFFRSEGALGVNPLPCRVQCVILTWEWGAYLGPEALEKGVDVCISSWNRLHPNTHAGLAKAGGNYLNSQLMKMDALINGYSEGIALQTNGYVAEGSGENIFVVARRWGDKEPTLFTPPFAASILSGITRATVMSLATEMGYKVEEQALPREALYASDEVFFCGTACEITPIRTIDRIKIGQGTRGPVTERLQRHFLGIVNGGIEDTYGWLDPVEG